MTDARANRPPPAPPTTIRMLRNQGVHWIHVSCTAPNCLHGANLQLDALGLPVGAKTELNSDSPVPSGGDPASAERLADIPGLPATRTTLKWRGEHG